MMIETYDGRVNVIYESAVLKQYAGEQVIVIDNKFMLNYNAFNHRWFCMDFNEYHDITDMLPESIDVKPLLSNESLMAYAYSRKPEWNVIEDYISHYRNEIVKLESLKQ